MTWWHTLLLNVCIEQINRIISIISDIFISIRCIDRGGTAIPNSSHACSNKPLTLMEFSFFLHLLAKGYPRLNVHHTYTVYILTVEQTLYNFLETCILLDFTVV